MLADAGAPAVLAGVPHAVMLADAGAPAVLASAPLAVMLADASAPAVSYRCAIRLTNERKKRTFSAVPTSLHLAAFVKKYIQVRQEVV
jgi:hypothetical protein